MKDFLLFKKIFENTKGKDQPERFDEANKKLNELKALFIKESSDIGNIFKNEKYAVIFKNIKEDISKKPIEVSNEFYNQMINNFDIKDKNIKEEIKMIINSKKYENIVKSIKYFFDNFL